MAQLALQNLDFDHCAKNVPLGAFQRQLRPRRVDGRTQQVARCAPVHSAGSQLPLEGTDMNLFAQMAKSSRFCNARCATLDGTSLSSRDLVELIRPLVDVVLISLRVAGRRVPALRL